jgi:hypothetical protein
VLVPRKKQLSQSASGEPNGALAARVTPPPSSAREESSMAKPEIVIMKIARRGYPKLQAKTWVLIEPGWKVEGALTVTTSGYDMVIVSLEVPLYIEYKGVRVH